ncbi:DUF6625 family protein [Methylobacillus sp. Pita2]|uniref:DUF6625 family protein n=1 Tax=Methylobacillus sp. Pita2 TaxID=3383245 RepID=UPI0038B4C9F9
MQSVKQPSICILIPYFGAWPFWMSIFMESCRYNSSIDWILYTDCGTPDNCPGNVRVVDITYSDYCRKISIFLDLKFMPENSYKLCDIKPALGYIHADELVGYDFWGYSDIDLVYGDLRAYFSNERLQSKDLFSTTGRRVSGHFCLMRNTEEMRSAFMRAKDWRQVLSSNQHAAFDEKHFSKIFIRHKNSLSIIRTMAAKFDSWLTKAEFNETYVTPNARIPWVDGTYNFPTEWYWTNGIVTNNLTGGHGFPYFHFMVWKSKWSKSAMTSMLDLGNMRSEAVFTERGITVV